MSMTASRVEFFSRSEPRPSTRLATALELLLVYAGILLYIWRWQFTHPRVWMFWAAALLASHLAHRDALRELGLTWHELRAAAQAVLPLTLCLAIPLVLYGFVSRKLILGAPGKRAIMMFFAYGLWCLFQQYLAQSYFYRRLERVVRNPHLSAALVALMFGAAHIPNPILMVATTLGGFVLSEVFVRRRNIWPLALAQTVVGYLMAGLSPASLIHNMRVGPAYFFYGLR